jgi:hypothetical protein
VADGRQWFPEEMPRRRRDRKAVGAVVLIVAGLMLFGLQFAGGYAGPLTLIVVGALFLVLYAWRFSYVGLVAGCVLAGLGVGTLLDRALDTRADLTLVGLGAGLVAVYAVDLARVHWTHWWPLIPGVVLILVGALQDRPHAWTWIGRLWPLVLVAAGVVVLVQWRATRRTRGGRSVERRGEGAATPPPRPGGDDRDDGFA